MAIPSSTNPETGETFVLINNEWKPVPTSTNPENGETFGLVNNSWQSLGVIDYFANQVKAPESTMEDYASAVAAGAGKILPTAIGGIADIVSMATGDRYGKDTSDYFKELGKSVDDYWLTENAKRQTREFEQIMQSEDTDFGDAFVHLIDNPPVLANQAVTTIGSMLLPAGAAGAVGKGLKALKVAKPLVDKSVTGTTLLITATQNAADTFNSDNIKDAPIEDRYRAASISAAVSLLAGIATKGGAEGTIARKLTDDLPAGKATLEEAKGFLKTVGAGLGRETAQESTEEAGGIAGEISAGADISGKQAGKRIGVSGTMGAILGGGTEAATYRAAPKEQPPPAAEGETPALEEAPAPETPPVDSKREAAINAIAERYMRRNIPEDDARAMATTEVDRTKAAAVQAEKDDIAKTVAMMTKPAETELQVRTTEYLDAGYSAEEAAARAAADIENEGAYDAEAAAEAEAATTEVAGEPTGVGAGVSPEAPVSATVEPTPAGASEGAERLGVVRAGETTEPTVGAEGTEPAALIEEAAPSPYDSAVQKLTAREIKPTVPALQESLGIKRKEAQDLMNQLQANQIVSPVAKGKREILIPAPEAQVTEETVPAEEPVAETPTEPVAEAPIAEEPVAETPTEPVAEPIAEPVVAAEPVPAKKRGRPAFARTEDETAEAEAKRSAQRVAANKLARQVVKYAKVLDKYRAAPEDEKDNLLRTETIANLYDISRKYKGTKPAERAAELLKAADITKEDIDEAKATYEKARALPKTYKSVRPVVGENVDVNTVKALGAARKRQVSGQPVVSQLKQLVRRLRNIAKDRKRKAVAMQKAEPLFKLLDKSVAEGNMTERGAKIVKWFVSKAPHLVSDIQFDLRRPESDRLAGGAYNIAERLVTLFEGNFNSGTIIHEIAHDLERMLPENLQNAVIDLWVDQFHAAEQAAANDDQRTFFGVLGAYHFGSEDTIGQSYLYNEAIRLISEGKVPAEFYQYVSPSEFWADNLSDIVRNKFASVEKGLVAQIKNWLRELGAKLKEIFGMPEGSLLDQALNSLAQGDGKFNSKTMLLEQFERREAEPEATPEAKPKATRATLSALAPKRQDIRTQEQVEQDVDAAEAKVRKSKKVEELSKGVSTLQALRDPSKIWPAFKRMWRALSNKERKYVLSLTTTDFIAHGPGEQIPELRNTYRLMQKMSGMTDQLLAAGGDMAKSLHRAFQKDPKLQAKMEALVLESTLAEKDPSDKDDLPRSKTLDSKYKALGEEGMKLFKELREYYEDMASYYDKLLEDQIALLGLDSESKAAIMTKIREIYETEARITPYFPLVRRGDYWFSLGAGENKEFYLYETMEERDAAIEDLAKEKFPADKNPIAKFKDSRNFKLGNNIAELRESSYDSSKMLSSIFQTLDGTNFSESDVRDSLKDAIYQIYIQTMPERSFRNQFTHRKGRTGFSSDLVRNTSQTAVRMATQLARIKYAPLLRNSISQARDSIVGREELSPYVEEMNKRVRARLLPEPGGDGVKIAQFMNRASFVWYMSGWSSALVQPTSIFITGLPTLSKYGTKAAAVELGKMLAFWNTMGVRKKNVDGTTSWVAPSIENAKNLTPIQRRAVREMQQRGITKSTYTSALYEYKNTPTEEFDSARSKAMRTVDMLIGGLMHSTERISREVVYMAAFNLAYQKEIAAKVNPEQAFENAVNQAVLDTTESLNDYDASNRPPVMNGVPGRIALQFRMYPLHITLYLIKNFKSMLPLLNAEGKAEAAKKFFGTLGMTFIFAGVSGLPLFSATMGLLGAAWGDMGDDDEMPDEMRETDFETWWRTKWLPQVMGQMRMAGIDFGDWSDTIDRGLMNKLTGWDWASRTALNDMWLRDTKESGTAAEGVNDLLLSLLGPFPSVIQRLSKSYDAFALGDHQKAMEQGFPAFMRNLAIMNRYRTEGMQSLEGATLIDPDKFTTGELIGQAIGFRPDTTASIQTATFKLTAAETKIKNERAQLLRKLNFAKRKENADKFEEVKQEIFKFNRKHPSYGINDESIYKSIMAKQKQKLIEYNAAGFPLSEKNRNLVQDSLKPMLKKLEERNKE